MQITPISPVMPPGTAQAQRPVAAATDTGAQVRLLNPQPVIDPAIGIVVTEYFNKAGEMTEQYPTATAVETYKLYGLHGDPDATTVTK